MKHTGFLFEGPNESAGGKGGIAPLFHVSRCSPALPQHKRWARNKL